MGHLKVASRTEDLRSLLHRRGPSPTTCSGIDVPAKSDVLEEPGEIRGVRVEFPCRLRHVQADPEATVEGTAHGLGCTEARGGTEGGGGSMARKHDLSIRRWEDWEDELLRAAARDNLESGIRHGHNGEGGSRYAAVAARLGRTRSAVAMRASRLGVRSQRGHGRTVLGFALLRSVAHAAAGALVHASGTPDGIRAGRLRTAGGPAHAPMAEGAGGRKGA